jgi:hypothetical protein
MVRSSERSDGVVELGSRVVRDRGRVILCDGDDATWCCETRQAQNSSSPQCPRLQLKRADPPSSADRPSRPRYARSGLASVTDRTDRVSRVLVTLPLYPGLPSRPPTRPLETPTLVILVAEARHTTTYTLNFLTHPVQDEACSALGCAGGLLVITFKSTGCHPFGVILLRMITQASSPLANPSSTDLFSPILLRIKHQHE